MVKGIVKFYNQAKGFGFISPDGGGADVFVPAITLSTSKVDTLKAGQRVTFEIQADKKGVKAGNLVIEADSPREEPPARPTVSVHHDASSEEAADVLAALHAMGEEFLSIDYVTSPLSQDQLQQLSILLRGANQSLVRRYHPLFLELQLDDRFIGDSEFWTAVAEHPQLINGPILTLGNRARICKTESEVRSFVGVDASPERRHKTISPRILAMIKGNGAERQPENDVVTTSTEIARNSASAKPAAKEKAKQRVTEKREKKRAPPPKKKPKPRGTPKARAQIKKTGRKKK